MISSGGSLRNALYTAFCQEGQTEALLQTKKEGATMFKQKPQEDRDSPKAAAGGKGSLLRRRWKLLAVGGCVLVAAGVLAARTLWPPISASRWARDG